MTFSSACAVILRASSFAVISVADEHEGDPLVFFELGRGAEQEIQILMDAEAARIKDDEFPR
jgi:hypothetical protein